MKDAKVEADETEMRLRAMAVASGLMTEGEAEEWIYVKAGKMGVGAFKGAVPPACPGCGSDHSQEEWVPLEIGMSRDMPEATRNAFMHMISQCNGTVN